ncbi:hypothetical protein SAMN05660706_11284 [Desulfoscipio geothermicus DSM 3669]|uniref:Uncharacterized protein n=1 Tax=Desulfoscipio geothermicus DSM 3669 TaxID=1121426 RepID=A0A1I6DJT9_9FIRM|nr:hypothetical protein SAMN05660706_11284 [Desulfoscipio geothermicus DSM 3669]
MRCEAMHQVMQSIVFFVSVAQKKQPGSLSVPVLLLVLDLHINIDNSFYSNEILNFQTREPEL